MDYVLKTSYKMLRLQNCNNTKITLYINTCEMFFHINMKPSVFSRYLGWLMTEVGVARKLLLQLLLRILPLFFSDTDSIKSACKLFEVLLLLLPLLYCDTDFITFIQSAYRCRMG